MVARGGSDLRVQRKVGFTMSDELDEQPKPSSLPNLIAWLGLCLLSASLGRLMPATLQKVWCYAGLFGLAAGVGLGVLEQSRRARQEREQRTARQRYQEQQLQKYVPHIGAACDQRPVQGMRVL